MALTYKSSSTIHTLESALVDVSAFSISPMGHTVPISGYDALLKRNYAHAAFVPDPLPTQLQLSPRTYKLVSEAERELGRLDAAATRLPNPALLIRPTLMREAVSTSALEGTYAPLAAILEADLEEPSGYTADVREVLNYVAAARRGIVLIETKPICLTVVAELQKLLVQGTRGDLFDAGDLRTSQVYIGERSAGIEGSRFVPPPPGDQLRDGISDWEKWIHADDDIPLLIKVALGHYQFEALHPFSDGNGRLGRLIVVLQLIESGALRHPVLNISPWFEPRKEQYKGHLLAVSRDGTMDAWIQFFSEGLKEQAIDTVRRIDKLIEVRDDMLSQLRATKAKGVVLDIVHDLIEWPIIDATQAASLHHVTYPPAAEALRRLESMGLVQEITGRSYGRRYAARRILDALDGR